jgi:cardiolipin synthase
MPTDMIERIVLMAIYAAQHEIVLTTPYFVPDEPFLAALLSAAERGVAVTLVVPARVDSVLVRLGSRAFQADLLTAGARVMQFEGGLLHTKSIAIDGEISLFGSLNLDPRSLHLNFEITLGVYDKDFTARLRSLQQSYIAKSSSLDVATWNERGKVNRLLENSARLLGPLI